MTRPETKDRVPAGWRSGRPQIVAIFAIVLLTSCASVRLIEVQDVDTLFFGTAYTGGVVSEAEWRAFVDEVITPRFPGFTEWTATGHWRGEREMTHVVAVAHLHRMENDQKIREIIDAYKSRFHQQSVFLVREQALAEAK